MKTLSTKVHHHQQQQQAAAVHQAFDNLAKAAAHSQSTAAYDALSLPQQQYLFNEKCYWEKIERPLVTEKTSVFSITPPSPTTHRDLQHEQLMIPTNSFICESASRVLFQSIDWIKNNRCFQTLESQTQIVLLKTYWLPLFILSLFQCSSTINLSNILSVLLAKTLDNNESTKWRELHRIRSLLHEFDRLQLTSFEYAYLKLISIFNPNTIAECAPSCNQIEAYRILTYKELREHINDRSVSTSSEKYGGDSERLGRLLLKLPLLAELNTGIVEEIFFVGLIGSVQIDKIIPCILKMNVASSPLPPPLPTLQIKCETSEQLQQQQQFLLSSSL